MEWETTLTLRKITEEADISL